MCYRCEVCKTPSQPNQAMQRIILYKPDGQIKQEFSLCPSCKSAIGNSEAGFRRLKNLYELNRKRKEEQKAIATALAPSPRTKVVFSEAELSQAQRPN
jgi:hypothetical protein